MSRKEDCWDNAAVESFFATLKTELFDQEIFRTRAQARATISVKWDGVAGNWSGPPYQVTTDPP